MKGTAERRYFQCIIPGMTGGVSESACKSRMKKKPHDIFTITYCQGCPKKPGKPPEPKGGEPSAPNPSATAKSPTVKADKPADIPATSPERKPAPCRLAGCPEPVAHPGKPGAGGVYCEEHLRASAIVGARKRAFKDGGVPDPDFNLLDELIFAQWYFGWLADRVAEGQIFLGQVQMWAREAEQAAE